MSCRSINATAHTLGKVRRTQALLVELAALDRADACRIPLRNELIGECPTAARLEEIRRAIDPAVDTLGARLHRMPTVTEIAAELGLDRVDVTRALIVRNLHRIRSAGTPEGAVSEPDPDARDGDDMVIEARIAVWPLARALAERERQMLIMRLYDSRRQAEIAEQLGVSPVQVSRVLTRTLNALQEKASPG
ncbi:sigma factor-like helix-turn-helix DNA-binding protein [Nocardia jejuensis]|uniref:sigma factor-like helix-turn-helix DNA-binding protein n=1 Tax=Nocardia jejuensis TaxID=328049 RepID=UPI0008300A56|nr:sigma factor-like helix-turn-helix DNA-binding protein [Nocardia jejuensis]